MSYPFFVFIDPATTDIYTLSLHDALPISQNTRPSRLQLRRWRQWSAASIPAPSQSVRCRPLAPRSEEHTSELQSHSDLVCRLLLEKKKEDRARRDLRRSATARTSPDHDWR